ASAAACVAESPSRPADVSASGPASAFRSPPQAATPAESRATIRAFRRWRGRFGLIRTTPWVGLVIGVWLQAARSYAAARTMHRRVRRLPPTARYKRTHRLRGGSRLGIRHGCDGHQFYPAIGSPAFGRRIV